MADSWAAFIAVRRVLINEMRLEEKSCTEIAQTLSMDPGQVYLISEVEGDARNAPFDAVKSIKDAQERGMQAIKNAMRHR